MATTSAIKADAIPLLSLIILKKFPSLPAFKKLGSRTNIGIIQVITIDCVITVDLNYT